MKNTRLFLILLALLAIGQAQAQRLSGLGTTQDPYLITESDQNTITQTVTKGSTYSNQTVNLNADNMAGSRSDATDFHAFYGTFDVKGRNGTRNDEVPCLPPHGEYDNRTAWCGEEDVVQTTDMVEGWNWFSTYIEMDSIELLNLLKVSLGENADQIQSSNPYTEFDGEEWWGDLDDVGITNEEMYKILANTDCTVELTGAPANPANHAITINEGWNWIGFPSAVELSLADALVSFEAEEGDQFQGSESYTEFDGEEWWGDLETLTPGQGYMYLSNSNETKTLIYQTGGAKAR